MFSSVNFCFYRPQTKLREGNVFTPVCYSAHKGGVWIGGCAPPRHPPDTHPCGHRPVSTPWTHTPTMVNKQAVRILLECFLVVLWIDVIAPMSLIV